MRRAVNESAASEEAIKNGYYLKDKRRKQPGMVLENAGVVHWVGEELLDRYEYGVWQRYASGL